MSLQSTYQSRKALLVENLETMGVTGYSETDGLTTLINAVLEIGPIPPTPTPASLDLSLTAGKQILSYVDRASGNEYATLSALVLDENDDPLPGVSVSIYKDNVLWYTAETGAGGTISKTYDSEGVGDVGFTAECGSFVTESFTLQDCRFFDESSSSNVSKYGSSSAFSYDSTEQAYYISTSSAKNITRDSVVGDFDFEISMDFKATDSLTFFYCGESNGSSYECQGLIMGSSRTYKGVSTYYTNSSQSASGRQNRTSYNIDTTKWYHYKVTRVGNTLTAQILDGETVIATATDNNVTGTNNNVSWHNYVANGQLYWKNIKFKPL